MRIQTVLPDDEFLDDAISLTYNVEIGELHERDKFQWIEVITIQQHEDEDILFKKIKFLDFEFKMNHIKQIIKIEIIANYKKKSD